MGSFFTGIARRLNQIIILKTVIDYWKYRQAVKQKGGGSSRFSDTDIRNRQRSFADMHSSSRQQGYRELQH